MSDFHQNGVITTFHNLRTQSIEQQEEEVRAYAKQRPVTLVLPSLYSELQGKALGNIVQILSELAMKKESFTVDLINQKISVKNNEINFNVDPIIKDRLIHGYDDIEITLKNKQLIVDYENNKNKFHIWKNIVNERQ